MRGILVLALALGSFGGLAAGPMAHAGGGHDHRGADITHPWMW
jgi:hypothetical protein